MSLDIVLGLAIPAVLQASILVLVILHPPNEETRPPAPGTPEHRRTAMRLRVWGDSIMVGAMLVLVAEVFVYGRVGDDHPVLVAAVGFGAGGSLLGRL